MQWWQVFVCCTIICWGCYVPTIHEGQALLGGKSPSAGGLRAFLCVGFAYFLTAVVIPGILLLTTNMEDTTLFSGQQWKGSVVATLAGILGAAGALGIILSIKVGGSPLYIAPLVFAGAPIMSTFVTMAWKRPQTSPHWYFYVGIVLAAVGAFLVLYGKPK
jgi:hypothetical protein